jgi:DNA adenine methylase
MPAASSALPSANVVRATADPAARPFLKWAGGKKQLLADFARLYPPTRPGQAYHEPFLGSGAVFFHVTATLGPRAAVLSDSNGELVNTFRAVRDDVEAVIGALERHRRAHSETHFYRVREQQPAAMASPAARAARFIYLNKTCFNGLYRVNSRGQFNVPMGSYRNPTIVDAGRLRAASAALAGADLQAGPFAAVLDRARPGDFVYFDPPYVPVSSTAYFTAYTQGSFGADDQQQLADVFRTLAERGCAVMLSNSDTPLVRRLYAGFTLQRVRARRNINSRGDRRGAINELVVLSYRPPARSPVTRTR